MVVPLEVIGPHYSIRQGSMDLMSVRVVITLNMSFTSVSFSDIDGTTSTATETNFRWFRRGTLSSATLKMLVVALVWTKLLQLAIGLNISR